MTETALKNAVIRSIRKEFGSIVWIYKPHDQFTSGIPDLILCVMGSFVAIELKRPDEPGRKKLDATKLQEYTLAQIIQAYGQGYVCKSVDEVRQIIRRTLERRENNHVVGFDVAALNREGVSH
jgi:hypothetical protein